MSFLSSLTGSDIGDATLKALGKNQGLIDTLQNNGNVINNEARDNSLGVLNGASSLYDPYRDEGTRALSTYSGALGLNGPEGTAQAQSQFQAGPGYQFAMDQGNKAALRGASAAGMLNSGNTLTALTQFGQGLANQEYGSWLDRLNGVSSQGLQATDAKAGLNRDQSNIYQGYADNRLGLESGITQGTMGINNETAKVQEQQAQQKGSFLSGLLKTGLSLGSKAISGGLF